MALCCARLLPASRLGTNWYKKQYSLSSYITRRYLKEFPDLKLNNQLPKDHLIILPEPLNEKPEKNEILRLPKNGEEEINFNKINTELAYKGLSQTVRNAEDFVTDLSNETIPSGDSLRDFLSKLEEHLYPMDTTYNILITLLVTDSAKYNFTEIYQLLQRYSTLRQLRLSENLRDTFLKYVSPTVNLSEVENKMLHLYELESLNLPDLKSEEKFVVSQYKRFIKRDIKSFLNNLKEADSIFSHTVDDPDIIAAVASDFDCSTDLHHKARTPLRVTISTYDKFMKLCPDRFIRQNLWQVRNKRCSPKALPKLNNTHCITDLRVLRRKYANILGFRNHVELKLRDSLMKSRNEVIDNLRLLNEENKSRLSDVLQELNDYAADNNFEDPGQLGIQEYDVDYWSNRYAHEIVLGKSESEIRAYFPLPVVIRGLYDYFRSYLGIDLRKKNDNNSTWSNTNHVLEVYRKDQLIGTIIYDPLYRKDKKLLEPYYGRIRGKSKLFDSLPLSFISTAFTTKANSKEVNLSISDIMNLFQTFATVIQSFMFNYDFYEINIHGGLETEAKNLLPNLVIAHVLTDHRILQACSDRGSSKPIDRDLVTRILKAFTYFNSFKISDELYKAHLDLEAHSSTIDLNTVLREIYSTYKPFPKDPDNYDYCSMSEIFVGPNDGTQYANLVSKQLANFCLSRVLTNSQTGDLSSVELDKIKNLNESMLDTLLDSSKFDTSEKLASFVGSRFEPLKTSLGVF